MDRLLRAMRNTGSARQTGEMDPPPTSDDGLETVETGTHEISGSSASAASLRRMLRERRAAPMALWHLANTPALNIALSNVYFASLGLPELAVQG
jgi:hypothetical protein